MQKPKKCKYCKSLFEPKAFNQKNCYELECIKRFYYENKAKIQRVKKTRENLYLKEQKEKLKSIAKLKQEAKKPFQLYVRLRDKDKPCISCGKFEKNKWDGGHFKKAEIYNGVIFDLRNCHKQCVHCNRDLHGNELMYRESLVKQFGDEWVEKLESDAWQTKDNTWTREELIEIKKYWELKVKEIQKTL